METARDTIKYVKPVYTRPFKKDAAGKNMAGTHRDGEGDPYNMGDADRIPTREDGYGDINNGDAYRRAMYERTDGERFSNDLWNLHSTDGITFELAQNDGTGKVADGLPYIDGYTTIYTVKDGKEVALAIQDKVSKKFFVVPGFVADDDADLKFTFDFNAKTLTIGKEGSDDPVTAFKLDGAALTATDVKAYGLFNSEADWDGDYLGEVDIQFSDYEFNPRRTAIGVSWSTLSEIVLDTSFNVSAEEFLITYASQEIRVALDNRALKLAYATARSNGSKYTVQFDARYNTIVDTTGDTNRGAKDGYIDNAQTLPTAIAALGDVIYNDIDFSVAA